MSVKCGIQLMQIVDYAMGQLGALDWANVQSHIDLGCETCLTRLASFQGTVPEPEPEPEPEFVTEHLLAQALLDTHMLQPRMVGVRGTATMSRRRVYEAESRICIDIQQHEEVPGSWTLEGQVLVRGGDLSEVAQSMVILGRDGTQVKETQVDALGDFSIPEVPAGVYDLVVAFANAEVIIRGIEI